MTPVKTTLALLLATLLPVASPTPLLAQERAANFDKGGHPTRPIASPPKSPPFRAEPIDTQLRQSARDAVVTFSSDANSILRANAIEAAEKTMGDAARPIVLKGLSDGSPIVRFAGLVACGNLKYTDTKPQLLQLAYDGDSSVRMAARYALHKIGDTSLSQEMLVGLKDPSRGVRANTVMLLGMLGEKSAIAPLRKLQRDPEPSVRLQLCEALWRLGDPVAFEDLAIGTVSAYPDEQIISLYALAAPRDQRVMGHIQSRLIADHIEVQLAAARAAGMLGSDEGLGIALKYYKSNDARQRALAALAMGDIRRSDTQAQLKELLADPTPDVRLAAATALLKLKSPAATASTN